MYILKDNLLNIVKFIMLLLVATPVITTLIFQVHQQAIRHSMKEQLEKQLLQTIVVGENDIHWIKAEKEIWLNNRMFDVKSFCHKNSQYFLTGLYDDDETLLVKQLQKNQQQENNSGNKILLQILQLFPSSDEIPVDEFLPFLVISRQFPENNVPICSHYLSIITPPPQL